MKRAIFFVLVSMAMIGVVVLTVHHERECNARGGVLVKGQFDYVCVAAAGVKP